MIPGLWRCASRPWLDALGLLIHPIGVFLLLAVWGVLAAMGFRRGSYLAWRAFAVLGLESLGVHLALAVTAAIVSAVGGNPSGVVEGAVIVAIVASWATLAWIAIRAVRRWRAGAPVAPTPFETAARRTAVRLVVAFIAVLGIVHAWVPRSSPLVTHNAPLRFALYVFDRITMSVASDECLTARVIDYHAAARRMPKPEPSHENFAPDLARFVVSEPGNLANKELARRGDSRFEGELRILEGVLERGDPVEQRVAVDILLPWVTYRLGAHRLVVEWASSPAGPAGQLVVREWLACVRAGRRDSIGTYVDEQCKPRKARQRLDPHPTEFWE